VHWIVTRPPTCFYCYFPNWCHSRIWPQYRRKIFFLVRCSIMKRTGM